MARLELQPTLDLASSGGHSGLVGQAGRRVVNIGSSVGQETGRIGEVRGDPGAGEVSHSNATGKLLIQTSKVSGGCKQIRDGVVGKVLTAAKGEDEVLLDFDLILRIKAVLVQNSVVIHGGRAWGYRCLAVDRVIKIQIADAEGEVREFVLL